MVLRKRGVKLYSWSPYRDGITQSFIHQFLECREQARLRFVEGWFNTQSTIALDFGSCAHYVLSIISPRRKRITDRLITEVVEDYKKQQLKYAKKVSKEALKTMELVYNTVAVTLAEYYRFWDQDKANIEWVSVEKAFKIPYKVDSSRTVLLRGRWDGIFRRPKTKSLWLFETKTKSQIDEQGIQLTLPFDIQTMMYCLTIRQHYKEEPAGVYYNVIRRTMTKQKKGEELDEYLTRLKKEIKKDYKHYFKRWWVEFQPNDLNKWEKEVLRPIILQICHWYDELLDNTKEIKLHHYMNPDALYTKYGRSFMFDAITANNYSKLGQKSVPFPELED